MKKPKRIAVFAAALLCAVLAGGVRAQDLSLRAYVDRTTLAVNQQFVLTIEVSGADAQKVTIPQAPDLSQFADYLGTSSSQSIQIINGQMSVTRSAQNYFRARKAGKFQIPAVTLVYKGKRYSSRPIVMQIVQGGANPPPAAAPGGRQPRLRAQNSLEGNLFLRAEVSRKSVYPNQPVMVTYKLYTRVEILGYAISKLPNTVGFWTEEFKLPPQPPTSYEIVGGKRFLVATIRKVALFPTGPGEKEIEPLEVECEVRLRQPRRSRDLFDSFFNDDFFGDMFGKRVRTKIASKPIRINVKPLPEEGKPADFSGLVGSFRMSAKLDKQDVAANEAITLTVKYSGTGNIKMLPEPKIEFPPDIETYEPKVSLTIDRTGNAIRGSKTFEYVLIPRLAGVHRIRPIRFSYFDLPSGRYRTLESPEFVIRVSAPAGGTTPVTTGLTREEVRFIGKDIRFIKLSSEEFHRIGHYFYRTPWFVLLLILPLLAVGGAFAYQQQQARMAENVAYARSRRANQLARKRLSQARKLLKPETQKEFYAEISRALVGFVADKLNLPPAGIISDEVAGLLRDRGVPEEIVKEFLGCLQECDFQRFAPANATEQDMRDMYEKAKKAIVDLEKAKLS